MAEEPKKTDVESSADPGRTWKLAKIGLIIIFVAIVIYGLGGYASSSSGGLVPGGGGFLPNGNVTVYGVNISATAIPGIPTGGVSATQYTKPLQLSLPATLANMNDLDAALMLAKAICNG
jgi:hypothetical protein